MAKFALSQYAFESIVNDMVNIEENGNTIIEEVFPWPSEERDQFRRLLDDYVQQVGELLKDVRKTKKADHSLPFVVIGSEVEVEDLETQETFTLYLASPTQDNIQGGDVSCMSPVGRSLLLKKVSEEITVDAPGGTFCYRIRSIRLRE